MLSCGNRSKLIAIIVGVFVIGSMLYFIAKRVNNSAQIISPQEVFKNSGKESTTTAVDANSAFLEEEMTRKRQRDTDRKKCITDAEREYTEFSAQNPKCLGTRCLALMPRVQENIDRCYFRFPNN